MAKNSTHISNAFLFSHNEDLITGQACMKGKTEPSYVPGEAAIHNILHYSKALRMKKSKEVGVVEFVLN